jgi:16S rRNA (uracil1498-N3)-methyltransferase
MITLIVRPDELATERVEVTGEPYRHLFRARRLGAGDALRLVDGRGKARWAAVERVGRDAATLALADEAPSREPAFSLTLLVPTLRPERAAWLVEKATEIGVVAIRFLHTERAPREPGATTLARLERVARAAVEQCHRARVPELSGPHPWRELPALAARCGPGRWFLDPEAPASWGERSPAGGALLVGPEGGLTASERSELLATAWRPVGLGERILRIETAALVGSAALVLPPFT